MIVTENAIYEISNEGENNFSVNGVYKLEKIPKIVSCSFRYPILSIFCQNQEIYQFHISDYSISRAV